ncbi:MAG: deoxyribose-phosphate aldolase [Saprospiraceae bacterium]|jgi:deoxyribose-phosphate aldolase|nr:deoxyribose-phosphate aldolase [Saprospiraceae bacterium]MBP9194668.1 deoxyribose-phosphate aldolase [Saprospiraceae bacterium]
MRPLATYIDHTQLKAFCTENDIVNLCAEARQYQFAAVCVPPCYVGTAKEQLKDSEVKVCTVAGFPLGYNPTSVKLAECNYLLENGADEVDVVVNVSWIKSGKWSQVREEITALHQLIAEKKAVFKLIFETAYLSVEEILQLTELCLECCVDYLKTSTGFAPKGAELDTVVAIKEKIGDKAKIKASGGISDLSTALAFIEAGADRIGTSSGVKLVSDN